jgi:Cytochrome C oxidase, cbb3-type, subunit III
MIVQRCYKRAGNLHPARILAEPPCRYFYVMRNGYGAMPAYSAQLTPADRWSVAAYIRALQVSPSATESDVPAGVQGPNLKDIDEQRGYPDSFAQPWSLPCATAVSAEPPNASEGKPGMAPVTGDTPRVSTPYIPAAGGEAVTPHGVK